MKTLTAVKDLIVSKKMLIAKLLLFFSLAVFFIPLLILPFFDHASADDYVCGVLIKANGFWRSQQVFYNTWGGRFSATFFQFIFCRNDLIYSHYYLHTILILALDIFSFYFLLNTINRFFLVDDLIKRNSFILSIVANVLFYCIAADVCTFSFWFTSTITHHLPIIFFYAEIIISIHLIHSKNIPSKKFFSILLPVLIFILNGFSEVFVIIQFTLLCILFCVEFYKRKKRFYFFILSAFFIISFLIAFLSPGNFIRSQLITQSGFTSIVASFLSAVAQSLWSIFKNPSAWLIIAIVFLYGNFNAENFTKINPIQYLIKRRWILVFIAFFFLSAVTLICAWGTKGKLVPARYLNSVCVCMMLQFIVIAFSFGAAFEKKILNVETKNLKFKIMIAVAFSLCCSSYIVDAYKNILSASAYNNIVEERENILKNAAAKNAKNVTEESYDLAFKNYMLQHYPHCSSTFYKLAEQKPSFLFYDNGDNDDYKILTLKNFYGVDSVIIKK